MSEIAKVYSDIIDLVLAEHPKLTFCDATQGVTASATEMQTTSAYKSWLSRACKDVCYIESLGNEHFLEGKDAVQHLVLLSVHIVKQMLAKGVNPGVAIGLLPSEIAHRVHYMYWNTQT